MSPGTDQGRRLSAVDVDPNSLFVKYAVPELRRLEQKYRTMIESKKQDLRFMVGERYRDLIVAADSITAMHHSALDIEGRFKKISAECDASKLRRRGCDEIKTLNGGSGTSSSKNSLFSRAAHLKILIDIPEQIHRALENNQYFVAARLYLIARNIYRNIRHPLRSDEGSRQRVFMSKFPVAQRQWDVVSHFRKEITGLSSAYLSVTEIPDEVVARTLGSLMLLDNATVDGCLQRLLASRRSAVEATMSSECSISKVAFSAPHLAEAVARAASGFSKNSKLDPQHARAEDVKHHDLMKQSGQEPEVEAAALQLLAGIQIIVRTMKHVGRVFVGGRAENRTGQCLLATLIDTLRKGISVQELVPNTLADQAIPTNPMEYSLNATSTNFHLLLRHLPEYSQHFVPTLRSGSGDCVDAAHVQQVMCIWIQAMASIVSGAAETLLRTVAMHAGEVGIVNRLRPCSKLAEVRAIVFDILVSAEFEGDNEWNETCAQVLGKHLPIYTTFLRHAFLKNFKAAMTSWLDELVDSSTQNIRNMCDALATEGSDKPAEEDDLAAFVWEHGSFGENGTGNIHSAGEEDALAFGTLDGSALLEGYQRMISRCLLSETDSVATVMSEFRSSIEHLTLDARTVLEPRAFGGVPRHSVEEELNAVLRIDTEELSEHLLQEFVRGMGAYTDWLSKATEEQEAAIGALDSGLTLGGAGGRSSQAESRNRHVDAVLLIARLAKSLASEDEYGFRRFVSAVMQQKGDVQKLRTTAKSLSPRRKRSLSAGQTDKDIIELREKLLSLHVRSHDLWIQALCTRFEKELQEMLFSPKHSESAEMSTETWPRAIDDWLWGDACMIHNAWEGITLEESDESSEFTRKTVRLPTNASTALATELWQVNNEVYRVSGCGVDKQIVRILLDRLSDRALSVYGSFLDSRSADAPAADLDAAVSEVSRRPLSNKGALQMLFDVTFLMRIFDAKTSEDAWRKEMQRIKEQIEPIDLATLEPLIMANVEKYFDRTATLYGSMAGIAQKSSIRKQSSATRLSATATQIESHNVIGVAVQAPRFQMLPIGQLLPQTLQTASIPLQP